MVRRAGRGTHVKRQGQGAKLCEAPRHGSAPPSPSSRCARSRLPRSLAHTDPLPRCRGWSRARESASPPRPPSARPQCSTLIGPLPHSHPCWSRRQT
eukprot:1403022-Rhodomonas_salina.1